MKAIRSILSFAVGTLLWFERSITGMFSVATAPVLVGFAILAIWFSPGHAGLSFVAIAVAMIMAMQHSSFTRGFSFKTFMYTIFGDGVALSRRSSAIRSMKHYTFDNIAVVFKRLIHFQSGDGHETVSFTRSSAVQFAL